MTSVDTLILQYLVRGEGAVGRSLAATAAGANRAEAQIDRLGAAQVRLSSTSNALGNALSNNAARLTTLGAVGALALSKIVRGSLNAAGQVQRVQLGFTTVLRDANGAALLLQKVQEFDIRTPFNFIQSAQGAQMLLASGFRQDLLPTLYAVGNAVVAAGKGTAEFMRGLAIMGKIKTTGVLQAVRVNQFASIGVNVRDILKKQLGLSDEEMINIGKLKLKADVVIPALIEGLNEQFKGGIERAANGYLGATEVLEGSLFKLSATVGKTVLSDAVSVLKWMTDATDAVTEFVSHHPDLVRMGIAITAIGSATALVAGGIATWRTMRNVSIAAAAAKTLLAKATDADTAAEARKAVVAGRESLAIRGTGLAAFEAARAKGVLGGATTVAAGQAAASATKLSALARARQLLSGAPAVLRAPLVSGASSAIPPQTFRRFGADFSRYVKVNMPSFGSAQAYGNVYHDLKTGQLVEASVAAKYEAEILKATRASQGFRAMLGRVTVGGAVLSGVGGILTGYSAAQDMKGSGYSTAQSYIYGAATGIGAAAASMFLPGGVVAVALGSAAGAAINHFYSDRLESQAKKGSGLDAQSQNAIDVARKNGDNATVAALYLQKSREAVAAGDPLMAASWRESANIARKRGNALNTVGSAQRNAAIGAQTQGYLDEMKDPYASGASTARNGTRYVTLAIPESRGDKYARAEEVRSRTPKLRDR